MSDVEDSEQVPPAPASLCFLFDGCLEQILRWLPLQQARCTARTCKAFERASVASVTGVGWHAPPAAATAATATATATATPFGVYGRIHGALDAIQGEEGETLLHCGLGTPCLDLRAAGDTVDCAALVHLLQIAFKPSAAANRVACATGTGLPSGTPRAPKEPGSKPVLKGLAVHSLAIRTKGILEALELYGEELEVLDLAGCHHLLAPKVFGSIRRWCKRLVFLDLSSRTDPTARLRGGGDFDVGVKDPGDRELASLLHGVGAGLVSLRLGDSSFLAEGVVRAIATFCTGLRELDIGTETSFSKTNISEESLVNLSAAPCARSLVYLGLRNRYCPGDEYIRALGTQFPNVRRLDLAGLSTVGYDVLETLAATLPLTHIDLSSPRRLRQFSVLGPRVLAAGCPDLLCVSFHGCYVDDGGVRVLCDSCPELRHINVSMTLVTEKSLPTLAKKDSLRWVNVRCCLNIDTTEGNRRAMADCRRRMSERERPGDRGTVLGMERPEGCRRRRAKCPAPRSPIDNLRGNAFHTPRYVETLDGGGGRGGGGERGGGGGRGEAGGGGGRGGERGRGAGRGEARGGGEGGGTGEGGRGVGGEGEGGGAVSSREAKEHACAIAAAVAPTVKHAANTRETHQEPLPLLPAGVGDLSLGASRRRGGNARRESLEARRLSAEAGRGGDGSSSETEANGPEPGTVPFDWDALPRGGPSGVLGSWKGFRGLSGDLAREVILELHPHTMVRFKTQFTPRTGGRSLSHGYLIHTSVHGSPWLELEVDDQGCVV